jgi:hypothetical protein
VLSGKEEEFQVNERTQALNAGRVVKDMQSVCFGGPLADCCLYSGGAQGSPARHLCGTVQQAGLTLVFSEYKKRPEREAVHMSPSRLHLRFRASVHDAVTRTTLSIPVLSSDSSLHGSDLTRR